MMSPYYGALPALRAATDPELQGKGGKYFGPNPFTNTCPAAERPNW